MFSRLYGFQSITSPEGSSPTASSTTTTRSIASPPATPATTTKNTKEKSIASLRADLAVGAFMDTWYEQGSGSWKNLGWWNTANALEAVIDYSLVRPYGNAVDVIQDVYEKRSGDMSGGFINYCYDDEGWWALAWLKAYDRIRDILYLETSESIFADITRGWDEEVCTGGIWWTKARKEKNAIENELFITLAARLYLRTQNPVYLDWAKRCWSWFQEAGMQGPDGLINDGVDLSTCRNNGYTTWTYNQGVILGGLADLYSITGDGSYLTTARQIAGSAMKYLVDERGILREPCESSPGGCGIDGSQFKGIFVRYLSYLYNSQLRASLSDVGQATPEVVEFLVGTRSFIQRQADSIWSNDRDVEGNTLGLHWAGPYAEANATTHTSGMDALVAAVSSAAV